MDLVKCLKINKDILQMISSKYPGGFVLNLTSPEGRYYQALKKDIEKGETALIRSGTPYKQEEHGK